MYELMDAGRNSFYLQAPAKVGIYRYSEDQVILIDSGSDKDAGRKIRQVLDARKWKLTAIFNTHSHADHIGGNRYLQGQTGCRIYIDPIESGFVRDPIWEPSLLYGGYPPKELQHKFLMAQGSNVLPLTEEALPEGLSALPLPGHSAGMTGFRTADDVVYLADCLASRETLEKYRIGYIYDIGSYLDTLKTVGEMQAALFVPAHAPASEDIRDLVQFNTDAVLQTAEDILRILAQAMTEEQLLQRIFAEYGMVMNFQQHALIGSTLRAYLSWLKENGRIEAFFEDNLLLWKQQG